MPIKLAEECDLALHNQTGQETLMSLTGKWIELIHKVATGNWKVRLIIAPVVGILYWGLIGLFIFLSFLVDRLLQLPKIFGYRWALIIGSPVIIIGFILMCFSIFHFLKVRGTPVPFSPPPKLVTDGPYRYARNPMLTGIFIQLFGLGILDNSLALILIFTPLFIFINYWELKRVEEPELEKRLGREYIDYKKRVPMFFPWWGN
jgi:protein-S-isoprenylcysteine O-methyltransferase Ste14